MFYRAKVTEVYDPLAGKIIKVINPNINGGVPFSCYAALPPGYEGVPGIESNVLISKIEDGGDQFWVWHSIIHLPAIVKPGVNDTPNQLGKNKVPNFLDLPGKEDQEDAMLVYENPASLDSYRGNSVPEIKSMADKEGNGLYLYQKDADSIQQHGVALRTGNGHGLILEDSLGGNPDGIKPNTMPSPIGRSEPSNYSRVVLFDKHGNRLEINSIEDLIQLVSLETIKVRAGRQIQIQVEGDGDGDIIIKNYGKGKLTLKTYGGPINIESASNISINSSGKIDINALGLLNINAAALLNITSAQHINILEQNLLKVPINVDGKLFFRNPGIQINGSPVATFA
jgi:hypothetical protein